MHTDVILKPPKSPPPPPPLWLWVVEVAGIIKKANACPLLRLACGLATVQYFTEPWHSLLLFFSAEGKPISKKALKKQQKEAEKAKKKAETAARLVRSWCVAW